MKLIPYLKSFSEVVKIPVCVCKESKFVFLSESSCLLMPFITKVYSCILKTDEPFIWIDGLLMFYKLQYKESAVILGPALSYLSTNHSITSTLLSADIFLTREEAVLLGNLLSKQSVIKYGAFVNCMNMMSLALLDKDYMPREIPVSHRELTNPESTIIENMETEWSNQNKQYVKRLEYYIEHGMEEEMLQLFETEDPAPYGELAPNDLRHYKNSMMVHIYIVRCAAHRGGLDEDLCIRIAQSYAQQCEAAQSVEELGKISYTLRLDFCRRTKKVRILSSNNFTITKAMHYIHDHRINKINASTIADALGVSPSYLCSEFKKETGMSIVTYIQKEKMELAEKLLLYSEYSLSEISAYLSFSSQSYFQAVFKKRTGKTPNEFRKMSSGK